MRAALPLLFTIPLGGCATTPHDSTTPDLADIGSTEEVCGLEAERGLEVGQCAPDFTLPDSAGRPFTLSAQRGKAALVDISAVW